MQNINFFVRKYDNMWYNNINSKNRYKKAKKYILKGVKNNGKIQKNKKTKK